MVSVGVERGTGSVWRVEAVYSRHSSPPDDLLGQHGVEFVYAAEEEETAGVMATVSVPVANVWRSSLRATASLGVLRTELRGSGTVGGDVSVTTKASKAGPALGAGLELPTPFVWDGLVLSFQAA